MFVHSSEDTLSLGFVFRHKATHTDVHVQRGPDVAVQHEGKKNKLDLLNVLRKSLFVL